MDARQRIATIIEAYDHQGVHRTASAVDNASGEWLVDHVRSLGLEPVLNEFDLERIDPVSASVEVAGLRIEGVPLYDCSYTGPEDLCQASRA